MLRVNVGLSRKLSKDYNSTGFSINLDGEVMAPVSDAEAVIEKVKELFDLAEEALGRQIERNDSEAAIAVSANAALVAVLQLCHAERAFILAVNHRGELIPRAAVPTSLPRRREEWGISNTIVDKVRRENRAVLSSDALRDFSQAHSVQSGKIRSVLYVPLHVDGKPIGVLYADNSAETGVFDIWDLRFLRALGQCVQLSLHNAQEMEESLDLSNARWRNFRNEILESHEIVGSSQSLLVTFERLRLLAAKQLPLLILGESGSGKELFAQAAHRLNPRSNKPFIPVNIAALSREVMESELFGHVKGAFTTAIKDRKGRFELADGGTLFLDEVAEIPLPVQAMLLRALESRQIERVGDDGGPGSVDVRLVCATNVDLEAAVARGDFRKDLYYRLAGAKIELPPLRSRTDDIDQLVPYLLRKIKSSKVCDSTAMARLKSCGWPGNVRQLVRVLEEVDAVCKSSIVTEADLPNYVGPSVSLGEETPSATTFPTLKDMIMHVEKMRMRFALSQADGKNERAIELLGIGREQFFRKKKLYEL